MKRLRISNRINSLEEKVRELDDNLSFFKKSTQEVLRKRYFDNILENGSIENNFGIDFSDFRYGIGALPCNACGTSSSCIFARTGAGILCESCGKELMSGIDEEIKSRSNKLREDVKELTDEKEKGLALIKLALDYNASIIATASMVVAGGRLKEISYKKLRKEMVKRADEYGKAIKEIVE